MRIRISEVQAGQRLVTIQQERGGPITLFRVLDTTEVQEALGVITKEAYPLSDFDNERRHASSARRQDTISTPDSVGRRGYGRGRRVGD